MNNPDYDMGRHKHRHVAVRTTLNYFRYSDLPTVTQQEVAKACGDLAHKIVELIEEDGPELTRAYRYLLHARDSFVRHAETVEAGDA